MTGAARNVGAGIAAALAAQGAKVIVNDLDLAAAQSTASTIPNATAVAFDVTDAAAVNAAIAGLGQIDILVNNAGIPAGMRPVRFREMGVGEWDRYVDINFYGSLHTIKSVIDPMCERGWGRIIQISSGAGRTGLSLGVSLYGASKSAAEGFVRHLAHEVARDGVTVNTLALGLMAHSVGDATARVAGTVPTGRLGLPEDVGAAVVYLASPEASWLTGQTIALNGGATSL